MKLEPRSCQRTVIGTLFYIYQHTHGFIYNKTTRTIKNDNSVFTIYYYIILLSLFYFINRINEVEQASIVRIQAAVGMTSIACIDYRHTFFLWRNIYFARCKATRGRVLHIVVHTISTLCHLLFLHIIFYVAFEPNTCHNFETP